MALPFAAAAAGRQRLKVERARGVIYMETVKSRSAGEEVCKVSVKPGGSGGRFEESTCGTKPRQISRADVGPNLLELPHRLRIEITLATTEADCRRDFAPHDV